MSISETILSAIENERRIKNKTTTIADNIRSKTGNNELLTLDGIVNNIDEVYKKGLSDGNNFNIGEVLDIIREATFAPNLFDKDNYEYVHSWNVAMHTLKTTETGLQWTNTAYPSGGGYLRLKLGLAKDFAGKTLTLSTKQFYSKFTQLILTTANDEEIRTGTTLFSGILQKNGTYISRLELDDVEYTDEKIIIRLYFDATETIVFDEIMIHDHYEALQPYVPYGYEPTINVEDYPSKISELYNKGLNNFITESMRVLQGYGARTNYEYAFYSHRDYGYWNPITFYPQYDIRGTNFSRAFYGFGGNPYTREGLDLTSRLEECGVVLDTSEATTLSTMFHNSTFTRIPTLDCRNCVDDGLSSVLGYNNIVTVDKMIVKRTLKYTNSFSSSYGLENITFEGEIGQDISFKACSNLSVDSVKNIILHLVNYSGTSESGTHTLTLNDSTKTAMAELGTIPEFNNKTYDAYLTDIGWNLA